MKLHAILKNDRGGKKSTSDDTRILIELSYKNQIVGEVGLYVIRDYPSGDELGYRIVFKDETGGVGQVIKEVEKKIIDTSELGGKSKFDAMLKNIKEQKIKDEKEIWLCSRLGCNKQSVSNTDYCIDHQLP